MSTTAVTISCAVTACRRRPAKGASDGLCHTHHTEYTQDNESPLTLTNGTWVKGRHGIREWVPEA